MSIAVEAIGVVRAPRAGRADDYWGAVESRIELDERFDRVALAGLDAFSHAEIVFVFHEIGEDEVERRARHPRNNPAWPRVGIFAQRGAKRPNRIGVSRCRILAVEGRTVTVRGLDAIEGSPVLDIKPYMREFAPQGPVEQPEWATSLMEHYYDE